VKAKLTASVIKGIEATAKPFEVVDTELKGFLLRVQPSDQRTFYYSYRSRAGSRKRIKIGRCYSEVTPQQARDIATKYAGKVAEGLDVQQHKAKERQDATEAKQRTLKAFIDNQYRPWVLANRKTGLATLNRVESCFNDFMLLALSEITVAKIEAWRTNELSRDIKASTINRCVVALRGMITKAFEWDLIDKHPLEKLKPLATDRSPKVRYLTTKEETSLLKALAVRDTELKAARNRGNQHRAQRGYQLLPNLTECNFADRMTPLILLALKTGLRRGELFDLEWQDVDLPNKTITVRGDVAKSGHTRHIPLGPTAFKAINNWQSDNKPTQGLVFPADEGGRLDNVRKSWASILEKAKISNFRWHDMRHDFASQLVMKGVPLNTVRDLCGHADHNTTLRYAHLAPDHKSDAVALLG
jgi:integrase